MTRKIGIYVTTDKNNPNITKSISINLAPSRRRRGRVSRKRSTMSDTGETILGFLSLLFIWIPLLLLLIWTFPKFFAMVGIALATWIAYKIGLKIYSRRWDGR
ncbi:hypothetical protein WAX78_04225 [Bacillus sp. FJAT-53711]|uniref:Uncharacterized protein n=1 Tax=Bacillus yunxiaonensis TaxID=3127665 RepID=A0ABU8FTU6_9BACI